MAMKKAIGIDLGTSKCCVGVVRDRKVEILENERGNKTTPSYVAFTDTERLVGEDAKDQATLNHANTVFSVKRIIGREMTDALLVDASNKMPYAIMNKSEEKTRIRVSYKGTEELLLPQQITAMLLGKMKDLAEHHLKSKVEEAVISVPASFSNAQRQATKDAAAIAGLKVLALINEPTAAAIAYQANRRKTDDENVVVVDFGSGKLDVAIVTVRRDRVNVRAVSGSTAIGGDDIDEVLMEHVSREFEGKFKKKLPEIPAMTERLRSCCEKLKRKLSLLPKVQETLDCFGDDNVLPVTINRKDFNAMVPEVVQSSLRNCLRRATQASGIFQNDLSCVVLVGGSSRIPLFQKWLEEMFGQNPLDRSVNPDEAVAYGATLYAALLSGDNELDEFGVGDCVPNDYCFTSNGDTNMHPVFEQHSSITLPQRRVFMFNGQSPFNEKTRAHTFELYEELTGLMNPHRRIGTLSLEDEFRQAVAIISDVTFEVDRCGIFNAVVRLRPNHVFAEVVKNYAGKLSIDQLIIAIEREQQFRRDDLEEKERIEAMSRLEALSFHLQSMKVDTKAKELFPELVNRICDKAEENILWLDATNTVLKTVCKKREKILQELHNNLVLQLQEHEKKERERVAVVNELKDYLGKLEAFTSDPDVSKEREETAEMERRVVLTKHWLQSTKTPSIRECLERSVLLKKLHTILANKCEERRKETERITALSNLRAYYHHVEETLRNDSNGEDNRDLVDRVLDQVRVNLRWLDSASYISAAECVAKKSSLVESIAEMRQKMLAKKARKLRSYCNSLTSSVVTRKKYRDFDLPLVMHLEKEVSETSCWLGDGRTVSMETCDEKFSALQNLEATLKNSVEKHEENERNRIAAQQKFEAYIAEVNFSFPVLKKARNKDDKLVWDIVELTKAIRLWLKNAHAFSNADYEVKCQALFGLIDTLRIRIEEENKNTVTDKANEQLEAFKSNETYNLRVQQSQVNASSGTGNAGRQAPALGTSAASRQDGVVPREDREAVSDATRRSARTGGKQHKDEADGKTVMGLVRTYLYGNYK